MSYQYKGCTIGDHKSSCDHDWRAKKEKIAHTFKLKDPKFSGYSDLSVFSAWLANMECYFN